MDILGQSASEDPGKMFCGTGMSMDLSASEGPSKTFCGISMSMDQTHLRALVKRFVVSIRLSLDCKHAPKRFFLAQHPVEVSFFRELHLLFHRNVIAEDG